MNTNEYKRIAIELRILELRQEWDIRYTHRHNDDFDINRVILRKQIENYEKILESMTDNVLDSIEELSNSVRELSLKIKLDRLD